MTIDKAILLIEKCAQTHARYDRVETKEALKLGIEALKVVKEFRTGRYKTINSPLPGEGED